ncbi:MAG TPA: glycosyl hydrolase, partial [Verrucomicrobiae bacterium]|nr:glycosyl hydrolase [Verrucomicrobiae bacterium]
VTWWDEGKPWIDYITHCEFLLQQGYPIADVAYYTGESVPVETRIGEPTTPFGYDYDAINADVLLHRIVVKNGRLTLPNGISYSALVLPAEDPNMTPQMLERIAQLVREGATVIGQPPKNTPSLTDFPKSDKQVKKLAAELWGKCDGSNITENAVGKGHMVWGQSLSNVFAAQKLLPDFEFAKNSPDAKLAYVHRVAGDADIYFVSNQRTQDVSAECTFRVSGKTPELWHADTGVIERAPVWHEQDGRTVVSLTFDPAGSVFVIFREPISGDHVVSAKADADWQTVLAGDGNLLVKATSDGTAEFHTASGKTMHAIAANVPAPLTVSDGWSLSFPPNWGAPASVQLDKLISWTDHTNDGVRYFSGTATYEKDLEIPAERLAANSELWLDLGDVKNFAEVSLNGHDLGVLWKPPFRVNITSVAKPGTNKLVVKVTNLWPNRLIGDEQLPDDREWNGKQLAAWPDWLLEGKPSPTGRFTFTTWHHWYKDDALLESGLLGPVTLRTVEIVPVN